MGEIRRPRGSSAQGRSLWPVPGSRENPWAFFGYFLSQQKVTPRRGGETRQKAFRTRQECEGADWRVAVKENDAINNRSPCLGPRGSLFKKRPCGPVLKDRWYGALGFWRSPRLSNGQSRSGRGLSLRKYKDRMGKGSCLSQRHGFSRGLNQKMLPLAGEFRPISALRASLRSVALRNAPAGAGGGRPGAVRPGPGPD